MNDNEIIKALEEFHHRILKTNLSYHIREREMMAVVNALDLINRQKAEIERLQHEILSCNTKIEVLQEVKEQLEKDVFNAQMNCDSIAYDYELLKQEKSVVQSEAIKEFAERLKKVKVYSSERNECVVPVAQIDWVGQWFVKELTGSD